jgi:hypothetical protein
MWSKEIAAANEAIANREPAVPPRAVLEARINTLERRLAIVESSLRLLAATVKRRILEDDR